VSQAKKMTLHRVPVNSRTSLLFLLPTPFGTKGDGCKYLERRARLGGMGGPRIRCRLGELLQNFVC